VQVFPARDVFILTNVMKGVLDRGTAYGARSLGFRRIAAGKTGTTNDKRDAWFIGFTPQTLGLVWIGFDDNAPIGISGGEGAAPIWARYMIGATAGQPNVDWAPPEGIVFAQTDETSGGMALPQCPPRAVINEAYKEGTQPTMPCPLHSPQAPPPLAAVDQFGNPIALDTGAVTSTESGSVAPPPPPDSTLTGGVFRTDTAPPPPPPTDTTSTVPQPSTNTSEPQPSTNTSPPPPTPPTNTNT